MEMASAEVGAVLCTDKCVDKERWTVLESQTQVIAQAQPSVK